MDMLRPSKPVQAKPIKLPVNASLAQGFRLIARNCLAQVQENAFGVVLGGDSESVHQMRIGVRRLRSALRLFGRWLPISAHLQSELAWLAGQLGDARDADVLADITLPKVIRICPEQAQLQPLLQAASTIASEQRRMTAEATGSERYLQLMLDLSAWLERVSQIDRFDNKARSTLEASLKPRATEILAHRHKKLLDLGNRLAHVSTEERHRVRIMAKRVRYATEFFRSLYRGTATKRYINGLIALQDGLGLLNDAAVADRQLRQLAHSHPVLAADAEFVRGMLWGVARHELSTLTNLWKKFEANKPPF